MDFLREVKQRSQSWIPEKKRIEVLFEILGSTCLVDVDEDMVDAGNTHPLQFADRPNED